MVIIFTQYKTRSSLPWRSGVILLVVTLGLARCRPIPEETYTPTHHVATSFNQTDSAVIDGISQRLKPCLNCTALITTFGGGRNEPNMGAIIATGAFLGASFLVLLVTIWVKLKNKVRRSQNLQEASSTISEQNIPTEEVDEPSIHQTRSTNW